MSIPVHKSGFVDRVNLVLRGGKGGQGSVSFERRINGKKGRPDGGDGGDGGDIYLRSTLENQPFRFKKTTPKVFLWQWCRRRRW